MKPDVEGTSFGETGTSRFEFDERLSSRSEGSTPTSADRAILRTVTYAGLFQFPLTLAQLQQGLMDLSLDRETIETRLAEPYLRERVSVTRGEIHPRGREDWLALKEARGRHSRNLVERHRALLERIASFPFVRLVALSGGCAHENATDDDVDVFLVTRKNRAWIVCLSLMVLCKAAGVRRSLCLNYIVDEEALTLAEHDLFTASEIVGMKPFAGRTVYRRFVAANAWIEPLFPDFFAAFMAESESVSETGDRARIERVLETGVAALLEAVARRVLGAYLHRRMRSAAGVHLSPHRLKLHTQDHRPVFMQAFERALTLAEKR